MSRPKKMYHRKANIYWCLTEARMGHIVLLACLPENIQSALEIAKEIQDEQKLLKTVKATIVERGIKFELAR